MKAYLEIMSRVLEKGQWKGNRTGTRTLALPNQFFSHDMSDGFPLLTTKKMPIKTLSVELEGFIGGITSKRWYKDRGCKIWNEWCNPQKTADKIRNFIGNGSDQIKQWQLEEDDLGPIYGYQWRNFGQPYVGIHTGNYEGIDQLANIIETLKTNPNDRRMVCSAWNPAQLNEMALPPCHLCWVLTHIDGKLNLHWTQRSVDTFLGLSFNIASYGLLLEIICKTVGMKPGNLSGTLCDCHIYENHILQCEEQLTRGCITLPSIEILSDDIFQWTHKDIKLHDYFSHPAIKGDVSV